MIINTSPVSEILCRRFFTFIQLNAVGAINKQQPSKELCKRKLWNKNITLILSEFKVLMSPSDLHVTFFHLQKRFTHSNTRMICKPTNSVYCDNVESRLKILTVSLGQNIRRKQNQTTLGSHCSSAT